MNRKPAVLLVVLCAFILAAVPSLPSSGASSAVNITVMTRNVYIGANIADIADAPDFITKMQLMGQVFDAVKSTKFKHRAKKLADEIAANKPHIIGLQEVALWRTQTNPADGPLSPATSVAFDFLKILQKELKARGLNYKVAAKRNTFDLELPALYPGDPVDVRFTDRDVVLVRSMSSLKVNSVTKKKFSTVFSLPAGVFGDYSYNRGYIQLDGTLNNKPFRFINTHLEVLDFAIQEAQAAELVAGPGNSSKATIMVGDFNADPSGLISDSYTIIKNAGFKDAWKKANPTKSGFTCCQQGDLANDSSQLNSRIDFIFMRNAVNVQSAKLTGQKKATDKTTSGLWPSDHAGIVAKLRLK